ncbi:MAG: hypothetical protein J0L50_12370 [Sphingomonadales bacterium]|nr:hypothetical protein [Sphingomonadales bacterium]
MIQPLPASPMPAHVSPALPGEAAVAMGDEMAEKPDFSALLALETEAGETAVPAAAAMAAPALTGQTLATEAARTGKILPAGLPDAATARHQAEDDRPETDPLAEQAALFSIPVAVAPAPLPPGGVQSEPPAEAAPAPRQVPAMAAHVAVAGMMQQTGTAQPPRITTDNLPQVAEELPEAAASALPAPAAAGARKTTAMPVPAEEVQLDLSRLGPVQPHGEPRPPGEGAPTAASSAEAAIPTVQASSASSGMPGIQPLPAAVRPQDFSALIDRLAAAREAMVPQSVAVSVAHQDFGQIRLRFRSEDNVLSVAMTSADPGFARAAAAAPLPVMPGSASDQAGFTPQRGDSGQAQTSSSGNSGSSGSSGGGATPDPGDRQPQPGHHSAGERTAERADARRGIFV